MTFQVQDIRSSVVNRRPMPKELLNGQTAINYAQESPGLFFRTNTGELAKVGPPHVGAEPPTPDNYGKLSKGELWLNTTTDVLSIWNGDKWVDLPYTLEPATRVTLGGVIIGDGIGVTADGTISLTIPIATDTVLGGIKVGAGLVSESDGTLSATANVREVNPGTGILTNPSSGITTVGSVSLANSGVVAGTYTNADITVDATGRVISANSGTGVVNFGGNTDVTYPAPAAVAGDFYLNLVQGAAVGSWTGIVGQTVLVNQFVFFNSSGEWSLGGISDNSAYVTLSTNQSISGQKTFTSLVQALDVSATGTVSTNNLTWTGTATGILSDGTY